MTAIAEVRRLWGVLRRGAAGRIVLDLSAGEPNVRDMAGALLLTGMLADDSLSLALDLVSDPSQDPSLTGPRGWRGWSPVFAGVLDGTRTLMKLVDWTGGQGEKPAAGLFIGPGGYVDTKAAAFNFNEKKRVLSFSGVSDAKGIAAVSFAGTFATAPQVVLGAAVPNLPVGGIKAEVVAGSITKDGCQVKVTGAALLSSVVTALAGATATVIAIET